MSEDKELDKEIIAAAEKMHELCYTMEWEASKACVFCRFNGKLKKLDVSCFWPPPYHEDELDEMKARGMDIEAIKKE